MLTTEDILNIDNIDLHSANSNIDHHEDFLQQLSAELDIPMLLDQNDPVLTFGHCDDDLLSEVMSTDSTWQQYDNIDTLEQIDFLSIEPKSPDIKLECCTPTSPDSLYTDSITSHSPTPSQSSDGSRCSAEHKIETQLLTYDTPPVSPHEKHDTTLSVSPELFANNLKKVYIKRVPIQPKPPNITPVKNKRKLVPSDLICAQNSPVVVLENVQQTPPITTTTQVVNINPVQLSTVLYANKDELFTLSSDYDVKALKRQQRMIKNRESACLSRKKKKDYLMSLEKEVADLKQENQKLKQENTQLRERLFGKSKGITLSLPSKSSKNTAFLLAVLFMVSINVGSIGGYFNFNPQPIIQQDIPVETKHGRNLLWAPEQQIDAAELPIAVNLSNDLPICPKQYVNQTESVRLAEELHRWIAKPYNVSSVIKKRNRKYIKYNTKPEIRFSSYRKQRRLTQADNELQVFKPRPEAIYSEFFEAINRRDDTFYVVSFNADNMLLPALHHNNTRRPKMSLLLPAMLPNDTNSEPNYISLMQIDCEVLDTRLLHVKSGSIPQHLKNSSGNYTQENISPAVADKNMSNSQNAQDETRNEMYKPYFIKNGEIKSNIDRVYSAEKKVLKIH